MKKAFELNLNELMVDLGGVVLEKSLMNGNE
jgi:hypothetical protein